MTRILLFAGLGLGGLLSLTTSAHAQTAPAPQATTDSSRPAAQSDAPGEIGVICLTNACMKEASAPRRDPGAVARAIEAGDTAKVMMAGGTPADIIAALRLRLRNNPDAIFNPESANQAPLSLWMSSIDRHLNEGAIPQFIQNNGRTSLALFTSSGSLVAVTTAPGMNGEGIPLRGAAYDVPVPAPLPPPPPPFGEFSAQ